MPWQGGESQGNSPDEHSKYQYHPGGDPSKGVKDAPSALHTTIVPNVRLRRVRYLALHPMTALVLMAALNRPITNNSTSMARMTGERWNLNGTRRWAVGGAIRAIVRVASKKSCFPRSAHNAFRWQNLESRRPRKYRHGKFLTTFQISEVAACRTVHRNTQKHF